MEQSIESRVIEVIRLVAGEHGVRYSGVIRLDMRFGRYEGAKPGDFVELESLGALQIICLIEEEFQLELDEDEALDASTVKDLVDLVKRTLAEQYPSANEVPKDWSRAN